MRARDSAVDIVQLFTAFATDRDDSAVRAATKLIDGTLMMFRSALNAKGAPESASGQSAKR